MTNFRNYPSQNVEDKSHPGKSDKLLVNHAYPMSYNKRSREGQADTPTPTSDMWPTGINRVDKTNRIQTPQVNEANKRNFSGVMEQAISDALQKSSSINSPDYHKQNRSDY